MVHRPVRAAGAATLLYVVPAGAPVITFQAVVIRGTITRFVQQALLGGRRSP